MPTQFAIYKMKGNRKWYSWYYRQWLVELNASLISSIFMLLLSKQYLNHSRIRVEVNKFLHSTFREQIALKSSIIVVKSTQSLSSRRKPLIFGSPLKSIPINASVFFSFFCAEYFNSKHRFCTIILYLCCEWHFQFEFDAIWLHTLTFINCFVSRIIQQHDVIQSIVNPNPWTSKRFGFSKWRQIYSNLIITFFNFFLFFCNSKLSN